MQVKERVMETYYLHAQRDFLRLQVRAQRALSRMTHRTINGENVDQDDIDIVSAYIATLEIVGGIE